MQKCFFISLSCHTLKLFPTCVRVRDVTVEPNTNAVCNWPCCLPLKMDLIQVCFCLFFFVFFLWLYGKHSIGAEDFPLKPKSGYHLLPAVICCHMFVLMDHQKKTKSYSLLDLKIARCCQVAALKCFSLVPLNTIRITCKLFCVLSNVCHILTFFRLHATWPTEKAAACA